MKNRGVNADAPSAWHRIDALVGQALAMIPGEGHRIAAATGDLELFADPLIFNVLFTLIEHLVRNGTEGCRFTFRF